MHDDAIREALERNAKAVALRPSIGQKTGRTTVRLKPGLECELEDGPWKLTVGVGPASGGSNAGPGPGTLGRGALGSCLAIGYAMWAARLHVPIDSLAVEVQADYDTRGELGVSDDVPPGYTQVRYIVTIESPAPESDVRKVIATADKYSPYRDVFARANDIRRELRIVPAV
ncbi:MAG: hypothetical protein A3H96_02795 [Acidobacteria bacterium RIFCSPLOWO2_02_FULL_67_36]|nr:MAG: hypothetical protein A3H96_02795 [Acidobacteria bacterium RIFCSPLOWO2_02_FULL_67_36]OFW22668.1 MAG: hypothetical protein A3G21_10225 [Acidobacteria bacterium RIFCSPLOWO2_12_FULL_66_21]